MRRAAFAALLSVAAVLLVAPSDVAAEERASWPRPAPSPAAPRAIDLALCLDTSGSMQGLIDAARRKLWEVVNTLGTAKPQPALRVALLAYGSSGSEADGYVVVQTPFTTDLDLVSEKLFALGTNGGTEYVGRVVKHAVEGLTWGGEGALKILFVAGNESADQDRAAPFRQVVTKAAGLGVRVNAIYCGNPDDPDAGGWREVAAVGGGRWASIDHDRGLVAVASPFDKDLEDLSKRLNGTYLAYGGRAAEGKARQTAQDANAAGAPAAGAERAASKASRLYDNSAWDLVEVPEAELPEEMRKMTAEQRAAHLASKAREREELQAKVKELDTKRRAFVAEEIAKQGLDDSKALDRVLRETIREQAGAAGFEFSAR
jgi:hypothetical protein